eukprot:CAMPEP_0201552008 /NCGR_PEP_ID=MMETSP0173_2-20130828/12197_1 /ASSEMBLY_ACC=CAM_ASM_000268 /TAXON_ID=218659 /ORGANISM="Vexillifera sp., Strain DIVA3 564/2" /LENGTH=307 /DNA_ID=CAMNT_0047962399 /DNA_START=27 /DNA_END=950 /DNA_ORIENTATION=+
MSDPFGDIAGVQNVTESKHVGSGMLVDVPSIDITNHNQTKVNTRASPFARSNAPARSISQTYPKALHQKAEKDLSERIRYEQAMHAKLEELHATRERLYQLRFDTDRSKEEVGRDVQNLLRELGRLAAMLTKLRQQAMRNFARSLQLEELGIDAKKLLSSTVIGPKHHQIGRSSTAGASSSSDAKKSSGLVTETGLTVDYYDSSSSCDDDDGVYAEPLMRTQSTQTLKDKPASEKWAGLFRMFREWKHQKKVAEATHIIGRKETMLDSEIAKLRAAVFTLKQKKHLSSSDKQLLLILTKKLEALNKL